MAKPTKRKRSGSEVAEERVVVAEVALRRAALAYAEVAYLDLSVVGQFGGARKDDSA